MACVLVTDLYVYRSDDLVIPSRAEDKLVVSKMKYGSFSSTSLFE